MKLAKLLFVLLILTHFSCDFSIGDNDMNKDSDRLAFFLDDFESGRMVDQSGQGVEMLNIQNFNLINGDSCSASPYAKSDTQSFILVPLNELPLNTFSELSFVVWMKSFRSQEQEILGQFLGEEANPSSRLAIIRDRLTFGSFSQTFNNPDPIITKELLDGDWNMVSVCCRSINTGSDTIDIYVNGQKMYRNLVTSITFSNETDITMFKGFMGDIDKIHIYNHYLTEASIDSLYGAEEKDYLEQEVDEKQYEFSTPGGLFYYFTFDCRNSRLSCFEKISNDQDGLTPQFLNWRTGCSSRSEDESVFFTSDSRGTSRLLASFDSPLDDISSISISFWTVLSQDLQDTRPILSQGISNMNMLYFLNDELYFGDEQFRISENIDMTVRDSQWRMFTVTCADINIERGFSDSKITLYIDGEPIGESNGNNIDFIKNTEWIIGANKDFSKSYGERLDNIRFYNRVLSKVEIENIYEEEKCM